MNDVGKEMFENIMKNTPVVNISVNMLVGAGLYAILVTNPIHALLLIGSGVTIELISKFLKGRDMI